ncbi:unnamed protein product [Closterium sp. NIES-54]
MHLITYYLVRLGWPFSQRVLPFTPIPTLLHLLTPWHQVEMPIRCDLFDLHLPVAIRKDRSLSKCYDAYIM